MPFADIAFRTVRALVIIAAGVGVLLYLVRTRPKPESVSREHVAPLVETVPAFPSAEQFLVRTQGTVQPTRSAVVVAEVAGRIINRVAKLQEGARFTSGDLLLEIDPADLRLQVERLEAEVAQLSAEASQLATEKKNTQDLRSIAAREALLAQRELERARTLAAKETLAQEELEKREKSYLQSRTALQNLENQLRLWPDREQLLKARRRVAEASLAEARRNLQRTEVRAPFTGRVERVEAEIGEYVQPGRQLVRMWDDSSLEVRVNLPPEDVRWIVPTTTSQEVRRWIAGELDLGENLPEWIPPARLTYSVGGETYRWNGFVRGFEGLVEQQTRTVPATVEVRRTGTDEESGEQPPLLPGMFVRATIEGRTVDQVYTIPRSALLLDETVWVAEEGKLRKRNVDVLRTEGQRVYVTSGLLSGGADTPPPLRPGDLLVVSQLATPVEGMPVRIRQAPGPGERTSTAAERKAS